MDKRTPSLHDIALGMVARTIFTNFDLPPEEDDERMARQLQQVFLPLWFLEGDNERAAGEFMKSMDMNAPSVCGSIPEDAGMLWEYMDQAGPRSINGLPQFFTCRFLSKEDTRTVMRLVRRLMEKAEAQTPEDKAHHELLFWRSQ